MFYATSIPVNTQSSKIGFFPILQNENIVYGPSSLIYEHFSYHTLKQQRVYYGEIETNLLAETILNEKMYEQTVFENPGLKLKITDTHNIFLTNDHLLDSYSHIRNRAFINFFMKNLIDVPICFKKSKSVMFSTLELPVTKFINFLVKQGKKELCTRKVLNAFFLFFQNQKKKTPTEFNLLNKWIIFFRMFYLSTWNSLVNDNSISAERDLNHIGFFRTFSFANHVSPSLGLWALATNDFLVNNNFRLKNTLSAQLTQLLPIFTFYIYNVDKNIRKYSRGKSGKYLFIWKYVPAYKRSKTIVKVMAKQIKFYQYKTFFLRIFNNFKYLQDNAQNTFLFKKKVFSYNYVFKHFRHSLMRTYLTTCV